MKWVINIKPKIYYIGDLHLGHYNTLYKENNERPFDQRPFDNLEQMHNTIISNWNNKVTNADTVYILGDICWIENSETISIVSQLKGKKVAIAGNHDRFKDYRYNKLFESIEYQKTIQDTLDGKSTGVILSHFPIAFWSRNNSLNPDQTPRKHEIHLYAHVHNSKEYTLYQQFLEFIKENGISQKAYNVGCMLEYMNYTPMSLQEIVTLSTKTL